MNDRSAQMRKAGIVAVLLLVACSREKAKTTLGEQHDEARDRWALDSARMEADRVAAAAPSELAGSTWRLVQLRSSNDSVYTPERSAVYTIEFGTDGRASVVGGCNRGSGTWTTTPPHGLTFGPLATTRAMCPPGSMSARFLGDIERMRSYVIVDGKLHVSLMADGGIYEFVPEQAPEVPTATKAVPADVIFKCLDSTGALSRIIATFKAGNPATVTLVRGKAKAVASQVVSASGARYEGQGVTFWNKGRDAMVTWKGESLNCSSSIE